MKLSTSILTSVFAALVPYVSATDATTLSDDLSCVGTFIFGRHNDRVVKPANYLTTYGARRQVASGNFHRERYFGLDADGNSVDSDFVISGLNPEGYFVYGDTYAQTSAATVLEYSQISFLQGLYPQSNAVNEVKSLQISQEPQLANGTDVVSPLNGYQYVFMDIQQEDSEDYIWIRGDANCPASDDAVADWYNTDAFLSMNESTYDFYQSLSSVLPKKKWPKWKLNFGNAMSISDYMYVNSIHNETLAAEWNSTLLHQVLTLADSAQWGISYDANDKLNNFTIGGQTMLGAVVNYLNTTKVEGSPYINYFTGAFNTMYQIWGLMDLNLVSDNFTGMPDYGATLVWDLLQSNSSSDYFVQFSFRNGTDDTDLINSYPIFNSSSTVMAWDDFVSNMEKVSIRSLQSWCSACSSEAEQCVQYSSTYTEASDLKSKGVSLSELADGDYSSLNLDNGSSLSNAAAGGIGAGVTIGVFLILGAVAYLLFKSKKKSEPEAILPTTNKQAESIELNSNHSTL
ncbi:hypothetical protein CANARDRAFT_26284 [[Candida] arabinofermentans NRRL YB-2248]|uniref:Acid phosphatase n=1 Tax=[Candida] arabinofermentans NRRL YB-2248 TaxID=983967 RepID=A0A1E4T8Y7_9ASCO|nr:hypothetical protein CANARDRAFT_26284 [[Candida] arabinofermentans NRRL YB-2248]